MFKIYDPESPNEETCLRYMNPNRQKRGVVTVKIYDESEPPNTGQFKNRNRQMRGPL